MTTAGVPEDNLSQALAYYAEAYATEKLSAFGAVIPTGWIFRKATDQDVAAALLDDGGGDADYWARHWVVELQFYVPATHQWVICTTYHDLGGHVPVEVAIREFIRRVRRAAMIKAARTEDDAVVH